METTKKTLKIYGSGPAGLAAALYAIRAGISVTVFETGIFGGKLNEIAKLENFPGFPDGPGRVLAENEIKKLKSLGVEFTYSNAVDFSNADAILLTTGTIPRPLKFTPVPPASYCVLCDAPLYKNKHIAVIGSGNSAASGALYLSDLANSVTIMTDGELHAESTLLEKLSQKSNVEIKNTPATPENTAEFDGIFVLIGHVPLQI